MKVIYNTYIPLKDFYAINLFGIVFARKEYGKLGPEELNHEAIHTEQMKDLWFIPFYIWYITEWFIKLIVYRDTRKAYYNLSFEREAYNNHNNLEYIKKRKTFSFIKYLRKE